jgi:iron complex outermembrane receptor protein
MRKARFPVGICVVAVAVAIAAPRLNAQENQSEPAPAEVELSTVPVAPIPEEAAAAESATVLETIEVTGSHIRRTDYETAAPVLVITRADIERSGFTNIGEFLQEIPTAGSAQNRLFNHLGNGQTEIDLRNLGSKRVLVLVNGHRWIGGTDVLNTSAINLNTIPISLVDRIEILKDGASAIYGSDAIVGVVNIITRTDYIGNELQMFASGFIEGDAALQQSYQLSFGNMAGRTSLFLNLGYVQQSALMAGARDISAVPLVGTGLTRGSPTTPRGHALFVPTLARFSERCSAPRQSGLHGQAVWWTKLRET